MFPKRSENMSDIEKIRELLWERADVDARIKLLPYQGTVEVKTLEGGRYIYLRKREFGKLISTYVDKYSEETYAIVVKSTSQAKELNKRLRQIDKSLAKLGYSSSELSSRVLLNLDFAKANMKLNIYDQAILEGVATTYPQTETIIDNGIVSGMNVSDIQKILNLKHAWEFILNKDVISVKSDLYILSHIAKLVNEGFYETAGKLRSVPVKIGGCSYVPPVPIESVVKENLQEIFSSNDSAIDVAIEICLYCMKKQIFIDGNKRASVIFANHYLISKGQGLLVIPSEFVPEFKALLVKYYEDIDVKEIKLFLKEKCWRNF